MTAPREPALMKSDLLIIRQVYFAYLEFRMPFLPAAKWIKRAKALADRGLLNAHPLNGSPKIPSEEWFSFSFTPTHEGVHAYNRVMRRLRREAKKKARPRRGGRSPHKET